MTEVTPSLENSRFQAFFKITVLRSPVYSGGYFFFGHSPNITGCAQVRLLLACQPCICYLLPVNGSLGSNTLNWSLSASFCNCSATYILSQSEDSFHRLSFFESRDYRVVFVIQKGSLTPSWNQAAFIKVPLHPPCEGNGLSSGSAPAVTVGVPAKGQGFSSLAARYAAWNL